MKKYLQLTISALVSAFILEVFLIIFFGRTHGNHLLEQLAWAGETITGIAALMAVIGFLYQIKKDSADAAISQLKFFREEFMPASRRLFLHVRGHLNIGVQEPVASLNKIPDFSLEWIRKNKKEVADDQVKPFEENQELNAELIDVINMLEVFSQELIHKETVGHPALAAARPPFIEFVEATASVICTLMYINDDVYQGIKSVYEAWREEVDRDTLAVKIEKTRKKLQSERGGRP